MFGKKSLLSICPDEVRGATKRRVITDCDPDVYSRYRSCDASPPKGCYNEAVRYGQVTEFTINLVPLTLDTFAMMLPGESFTYTNSNGIIGKCLDG